MDNNEKIDDFLPSPSPPPPPPTPPEKILDSPAEPRTSLQLGTNSRPGRCPLNVRPNSATSGGGMSPAAAILPKGLDTTKRSDNNTIISGGDEKEKRLLPREVQSNLRGAGEGVSASNLQSKTSFQDISNEGLESLGIWLDKIPFSRQRKLVHRDFSDGVLMAEMISHFFPKMIELHNYASANNTALKKNNWELLNRKVLPKLGIKLQDAAVENICVAKPGFIEPVLIQVKKLIEKRNEEEELAKAIEMASSLNHGDCGDGSGSGASIPLTEVTCLVHLLPQDVPEFLIFRAKKYYPEELLGEKQKCIEESKDKIKDMASKVRRLETLVNLKEKHLEDLTRQIHELRLKLGEVQPHECVCKWEEGEEPPVYKNFS